MSTELELVAQQLNEALCPEDVFGDLKGNSEQKKEAAKRIFRRMSRATHPDLHRDNVTLAQRAFDRLNGMWQQAQEKIDAGIYGDRKPRKASVEPVIIKSGRTIYSVKDMIAEGDLCNIYDCTYGRAGHELPGVFKVTRDPADNDLLQNEAKILQKLMADKDNQNFQQYIPGLIESFEYREADTRITRHVNAFSLPADTTSHKEWYNLEEIRDYYNDGIPAPHMAWIWRRLLKALSFAEVNGIVHGAVLPPHILVNPKFHYVMLVDWSYAVDLTDSTSKKYISATSLQYEEAGWYPAEVFERSVPKPGLDIYMSAMSMVYLLGGDPIHKTLPGTVPSQLRHFLIDGIINLGSAVRPQDAWTLGQEFEELIDTLWKREFRDFFMLAKA